MKFSIKDFFSKCDQIRSFLKKPLMEKLIFCAVQTNEKSLQKTQFLVTIIMKHNLLLLLFYILSFIIRILIIPKLVNKFALDLHSWPVEQFFTHSAKVFKYTSTHNIYIMPTFGRNNRAALLIWYKKVIATYSTRRSLRAN